MSESALVNDSCADEESGMNSFSIQPNQFEPRRNSNESERDNESMLGEEGMEENTNYVYVPGYFIHFKYQ